MSTLARVMSSWSRPVVLPTFGTVAIHRTSNVAITSLSGRNPHCSFRSTGRMFSTTGGDDEHKGVLTTTTNIEDEKIHETDVLISDMTGEAIWKVEINGEKHLMLADDIYKSRSDTKVTMEGITHGDNHRVLVMAAVWARGNARKAVMLVDTGSPRTFLTEETFNALGIKVENMPMNKVQLLVNRRWVTVHLSQAHFADVNVLGTDFLSKADLHVSYLRKTVRITIPES
jgi:hypothetical protein